MSNNNTTPTKYPIQGDESIMSPKKHGTSNTPVQTDLRWGCNRDIADRICNFNRHYAEHSEYFSQKTTFVDDFNNNMKDSENITTFYDSNTGKPLFYAPRGRTSEAFLSESDDYGWPSFRDDEVNWDCVRCLPNGEVVSVDGTHLGHNLPDERGNRYCINIVSVAGMPTKS